MYKHYCVGVEERKDENVCVSAYVDKKRAGEFYLKLLKYWHKANVCNSFYTVFARFASRTQKQTLHHMSRISAE